VVLLYKLLLLLYPSGHRQEFGEEMLFVFQQAHRDCACRGFKARIRFSSREIAGLLVGAFREQMKVCKETLKGSAMRTFRFPRWTILILVLALLVVLAAIDKVGMASRTLSPGMAISPRWAFLQLLLAAALFVCVLSVIVFVLRAALGRTCIRA
jgi:hypothetical protein